MAAEIARSIFENNPELLYRAYLKAALKGNGYIFQTLSDRAYGKLRERIEHDVRPHAEATDEELVDRIKQLEQELGIPSSAPELPLSPSDLKPH